MGGADKLLQPVDGQSLLRMVAERACAASALVAVSLRSEDRARRAALEGLKVTLLDVPDAASGMAASLRAGAAWALRQPVQALMIALPDMPEITSEDMRALIAAQRDAPARPLRATSASHIPGHPVIIPQTLLKELLDLSGDEGARAVLRRHPPRLLALAGDRALTDLDTQADWAAWRARQSGPSHGD